MSLKNILGKFININTEIKLYIIGITLLIITSFINIKFPEHKTILMPFTFMSLACFCIGFLLWAIPLIKKFWPHWIGRTLIILLNAFTYFLSKTLSQNLIAEIIGLPPKDFPLTTEILTIIVFYIPIASLLLCFFIMFLCLIASLALPLVEYMIPVSNRFISFFAPHKFKNLIKNEFYGRLLGAIVFTALLLFLTENTIIKNLRFMPYIIKELSYYCDYYPSHLYPSISKEERVILHDNGVISSAKKYNGDILITIRNFKE